MVQRVAKRIADAAEANFHPGIGLVLMAKAGYDPSGAVDFWQRMTAYGKGKEPPAFLCDHPSNADRFAAIQREMPEAKANCVAHRYQQIIFFFHGPARGRSVAASPARW